MEWSLVLCDLIETWDIICKLHMWQLKSQDRTPMMKRQHIKPQCKKYALPNTKIPTPTTQKSVAFHSLAFCPWHYDRIPIEMCHIFFNRSHSRIRIRCAVMMTAISRERLSIPIWVNARCHCWCILITQCLVPEVSKKYSQLLWNNSTIMPNEKNKVKYECIDECEQAFKVHMSH